MSLVGVTSKEFTSESQDAFKSSVVKTTSTKYIDSITIDIYKYTDKTSRRSLLQQKSLDVSFNTSMTIVETNNNKDKVPDAQNAYSQFNEAMVTSLADGSFIKLLKASGISSFANATVSADSFKAQAYTVKYTDLSPTVAPTAAPTSKIATGNHDTTLSFGAIVSIIIVGAFLLAFFAVFVHLYRKHSYNRPVKVTPSMDDSFDLQSMYPSFYERQLTKRNPLSGVGNDDPVLSPEDIPITAMEEEEDEPASSLAMQDDGSFMYLCDILESNEMAIESSVDFIKKSSLVEESNAAEAKRKHAQYVQKSTSTDI